MTAAGQIPLFQETAAVTLSASALTSVDALADRAVAAIRDVMAQGKRVVVSCSFGKDSSVVLALALRALHAERDAGNDQTSVTVLTSNTGMENPVQDFYVAEEIRKVEAYAAAHWLPLSAHVARPSLSNNYLVNVLGGRMVATTPEMKARTCSNMMKVQPLTRAKRRLFAALGVAGDDIVSLVGTRFSESPERAIRMRERGETADHPFRSPQGEWMMSPIADWTGDQVFEYIGLVCSGLIPCYSDFEALVRFYRDAAEGECMVSAFVDGKQAARPCGSAARSGCWGCLALTSSPA